MKKNLFEMGAKFDDSWSSNNKIKKINQNREIKDFSKHKLYFLKEKRRGKNITIIKEFYLENKELKEILKTLKSKLGSGGTIKENSIELQGEVSIKAKDILKSIGFNFKS